MDFSLTTHQEEMSNVFGHLVDALQGSGQGGDIHTLMKDEGRRLAITFMGFTPPLGPGGRNSGARQAGEKAIERELKSLFSEARQPLIDDIGSQFGISNIKTWREEEGKQPLRIDWERLDATGARMAEYHKQAGGYRGKVPLRKQVAGVWKARVVVPMGMRGPYIQKVKRNVGRWRASVGAIIPLLGGTLPAWIARHLGSVSQYQILDVSKLNDPETPSIVFGTRFPGVSNPQYRYKERMAAAMRLRTKAMVARLRLILSGYAQDVSRRIRPLKRAAQTAMEPMPALE